MNILNNTIEQLKVEQKRKVKDLLSKKRDFIDKLNIEDRAFILTGSRGCGKSTWLLSRAKEENRGNCKTSKKW